MTLPQSARHTQLRTVRVRTFRSLALALLWCQSALASPYQARDGTPTKPVAKAGLGWTDGNSVNITHFTTSKVSWYYTWSPWPIMNPSPPSLEFVPMFWGPKQAADFQSQVNGMTINAQGLKNILGMNEPQEPTQGNISPGDGASMWKTYLEPLKYTNPGLRLGSPATTNAPSGKAWMQAWLGACGGGCTVDFIALHWYGINATDFIAHVTDFHDTFQRPIWVTEWACQNFGDPALGQCSAGQVSTFLNITQGWMDSTDYVERYSWFGAMTDLHNVNPANALMTPQGVITDLGKQYIGVGANGTIDGGVTFSSAARRGLMECSTMRVWMGFALTLNLVLWNLL